MGDLIDLIVGTAIVFSLGIWLGHFFGKWGEWSKRANRIHAYLLTDEHTKLTFEQKLAIRSFIDYLRRHQ